MLIRKLFKFENAHIVRGCSTRRCSHSIHGHPGEGARRHRVEQFVGQHHAVDGVRPAGQPAHPCQRLGQLARDSFALALRQLAGQLDDQVFGIGEAQPVELAQDLDGQRAGAGTELDHAVRAGFEPLGALARQAGTEKRAQFGRGDEVAGAAELAAAPGVVAELGFVQSHRHVLVQADPAATRTDALRDARSQHLAGSEGIGRRRRECGLGAHARHSTSSAG